GALAANNNSNNIEKRAKTMLESNVVSRILQALVICSVLLSSGCATITKGNSQSVTVNTEPTGATCLLSRDGQQIAAVNPTPGTIVVGKASGTISVDCKKLNYEDATGVLASTFQAMTFGNIIFGGIIGVAVDAA